MYNRSDSDFTVVENPESDFYGVKLLTGKYKDVTVIYGKVSIKEDKELDIGTLEFTWTCIDPAEFNDKELDKNEEFNNHLGDILTYIISDSLEKKKGQIGHINTNTDTRTQSST